MDLKVLHSAGIEYPASNGVARMETTGEEHHLLADGTPLVTIQEAADSEEEVPAMHEEGSHHAPESRVAAANTNEESDAAVFVPKVPDPDTKANYETARIEDVPTAQSTSRFFYQQISLVRALVFTCEIDRNRLSFVHGSIPHVALQRRVTVTGRNCIISLWHDPITSEHSGAVHIRDHAAGPVLVHMEADVYNYFRKCSACSRKGTRSKSIKITSG